MGRSSRVMAISLILGSSSQLILQAKIIPCKTQSQIFVTFYFQLSLMLNIFICKFIYKRTRKTFWVKTVMVLYFSKLDWPFCWAALYFSNSGGLCLFFNCSISFIWSRVSCFSSTEKHNCCSKEFFQCHSHFGEKCIFHFEKAFTFFIFLF